MRTQTDIVLRLEKSRKLLKKTVSRKKRSEVGQFLTPAPIARFMASLFEEPVDNVRVLDAGAGAGALFTALVANLCARADRPKSIEVVAYENDKKLVPHLEKAMILCREACEGVGIRFAGTVLCDDFISAALTQLDDGLFSNPTQKFTHAILNPPYKKINGETRTRKLLNAAEMETSNLYAAFVWLSTRLLETNGEIVAITPRSFCNGPYFRRFRKSLLDLVSLRRIHVFESRKEAFADDSVLQENIIFCGVRGEHQAKRLRISVSKDSQFEHMTFKEISFERVVLPGDNDSFIHVIGDDEDNRIMERMAQFTTTLDELRLEISTGRVVDFRAQEFLRQKPDAGTMPLIYPCHFDDGFVRWPVKDTRKPNAIEDREETRELFVPTGYYVLTRRFTAKEERRRVVAAIFDPERVEAPRIGFENHLNFFHTKGKGIPAELAKGLAVYLNSSLFDRYFRLFSGHTQVNATDLRKMRYPSRDEVMRLGTYVKKSMPNQKMIDSLIEQECGKNG
jgi:adenine-specific DNA-methyltransferase